MSEIDTFDHLLCSLYDAVTEPTGFQSFIERFIEVFELKAALMFTTNLVDQQVKGAWVAGIDACWLERYSAEFGTQDMLAHHLAQAPISRFYASNLDLDYQAFSGTQFYLNWVVPQNVAYATGAILLREGPWLSQITLQRSSAQPPFTRRELRRCNRLVPHLRRAVQMRQRFADLRLGQNMLTSGLNLIALPTILVDEFGRSSFVNGAAQRLLSLRDCLWSDNGHLGTSQRAVTQQLNLQTMLAVRASRGSTDDNPSVVLVPRRARQPLMLMVSPLRLPEGSEVKGAALIFAYDPEDAPQAASELVADLFGLTDAEASLAVALCAGYSLNEAAEARGTSLHTVRTQLKNLFAKTGTNCQADMVSTILSSPAYFVAARETASRPGKAVVTRP